MWRISKNHQLSKFFSVLNVIVRNCQSTANFNMIDYIEHWLYTTFFFTLEGESFILFSYILLFKLNKSYPQLELSSVECMIENEISLIKELQRRRVNKSRTLNISSYSVPLRYRVIHMDTSWCFKRVLWITYSLILVYVNFCFGPYFNIITFDAILP